MVSQYDIITVLLQLLSTAPAVRKTQLKAALGTFLFLCFHWPGYFKGCTKCVLQEQSESGISTQTYRWHSVKFSCSRKPSKSFMGKWPMCFKCPSAAFLLSEELHCRMHKWRWGLCSWQECDRVTAQEILLLKGWTACNYLRISCPVVFSLKLASSRSAGAVPQ